MSVSTAPGHRPILRRILDRWPAAVGIAFAVFVAAAGGTTAPVLVAAGFVYIGAAAVGRRSAAWPMFGVTFVLIGAGRFVPGVDPVTLMLAAGLLLAVAGFVLGRGRPGHGLPLQLAALLAIGAIAYLASTVSPQVAAVIVAVGLLAHAGWDVWHHRTGRVVSRSLAEFCMVLDALLGILVLWAAFG